MRLGLQGFACQAEALRKMLPGAGRKVNWRRQDVPEPGEDWVITGWESGKVQDKAQGVCLSVDGPP